MQDIHLVYVPEADQFRVDNLNRALIEHFSTPPGLRSAYEGLGALVNLPSSVGVITFFSQEKYRHRKESTRSYTRSTFYPLDVAEAALQTREREHVNPIQREAIYRRLNFLLANYSLSDDFYDPHLGIISCWSQFEDIARNVAGALERVGPAVSQLNALARKLEDAARKVTDEAAAEYLNDEARNLRVGDEVAANLRKMLELFVPNPALSRLDKFYDLAQASFNAHKVSRDFPLFYLRRGSIGLEFDEVTFDQEPVDNPNLDTIWNHPQDNPEQRESWRHLTALDRFGMTYDAPNLDTLIERLPEPKIVITDTYLDHHLPDLMPRVHSVTEFRYDEDRIAA